MHFSCVAKTKIDRFSMKYAVFKVYWLASNQYWNSQIFLPRVELIKQLQGLFATVCRCNGTVKLGWRRGRTSTSWVVTRPACLTPTPKKTSTMPLTAQRLVDTVSDGSRSLCLSAVTSVTCVCCVSTVLLCICWFVFLSCFHLFAHLYVLFTNKCFCFVISSSNLPTNHNVYAL